MDDKAGESQVQSQPVLNSETLSQKAKKQTKPKQPQRMTTFRTWKLIAICY
jgi:hypothetical protein